MHDELQSLKVVCNTLATRVRGMSRYGAYLEQSRGQAKLAQQIQRAGYHVELALRALKGELDEPASQGWLRSKIAMLGDRLVSTRDSGKEVSTAAAELASGDFSGSAGVIPIPDLLGFIRLQGKSGVLRIELAEEVIFIEFDSGDLVHAYSENSPPGMRLGEVLIEQGAIDKERLDSFLFCHAPSRGRLGEALSRGELVGEEALRRALEFQVQHVFHRLFASEGATFSFTSGPVSVSAGNTRMNVLHLLLESARAADEAGSDPHLEEGTPNARAS